MDPFEPIREAAAKLRDELGLDASATSMRIVHALIKKRDIELVLVPPGDPALVGGRAVFDEQVRAIFAESIANDGDQAALIAHEIGHAELHTSASCAGHDVDVSAPTELARVGLQRVDSYGARERRELQANVFAREVLLPRRAAYRLHVTEKLSATAITEVLRLPKNLVRQQIIDSLLLPPLRNTRDRAPARPQRPDPKQDIAAGHRGSAFLLQAGPGTGKTRTLVKRVLSLLDEGRDPAALLVLTYSNRAAAELFERIAASSRDAAAKMWIGTFHAFGLDVVRRYHDRFGLSSNPGLFDRSDAIDVLEDLLPTLPLVHFRNLWDPMLVLKDVLTAISRAKDEMVDAARYRALATAMASRAADADSRTKAEKCLEIAAIYDQYEMALANRDAVDFGDLIMRPAQLLESDPKVREELRLRHRHVLVDEYQDVNLASARFLRALVGHGERLWVVGDARQSIYRFRGASSGNMRSFGSDYPGATTDALGISYRSSKEVLAAVSAFARDMAASRGALQLVLEPAEDVVSGPAPDVEVHGTVDDEAAGVAERIRVLEKAGVPLREQAVLCRTNRRVDELAAALVSRGIGVLHLGSFFEREDVRNVLALMSLVVDRAGEGLVRVGALPRYGLSLQDVFVATQRLQAQERGFAAQNLGQVEADAALSPNGRVAIARLREDLAGFSAATSPWELVTTYLFDRTSWIADLGPLENAVARTRAIALWQLMMFLRQSWPSTHGPPVRRVLDQVRRLVLLAEERDLRHLPAGALDLDAVRLLTIHGSKGLEFEAVHVPGLAKASVPSNYQGARCPMVEGLVAAQPGTLDQARAAHDEEEECLFFVALSRAKRHLTLYRPTKQANGKQRHPSGYLERLQLRETIAATSATALASNASTVSITWPSDRIAESTDDLALYDKCPRRFFYTRVLGLHGARRDTPFVRAKRCLFDLIAWLAHARAERDISEADAKRELDRIWSERGPKEHAYAAEYRALADRLTEALVRCRAGGRHRKPERFEVPLATGRGVSVFPTEIEELADDAVIVRLIRTGRKRSDEYGRLEYALLRLGARVALGPKARVQVVHLESNDIDELDEDELKATTVEKRRVEAAKLLAALRAGTYPARRETFTCARCPHFFICDAAPMGTLDLSNGGTGSMEG